MAMLSLTDMQMVECLARIAGYLCDQKTLLLSALRQLCILRITKPRSQCTCDRLAQRTFFRLRDPLKGGTGIRIKSD